MMPDNVPPLHDPPTRGDRVLHHPEIAACVFAVIAGLWVALDTWTGIFWLVQVPAMLAVPAGILLAVAGAAVLTSNWWPKCRHWEQQGWLLMVTASVALTAAMLVTHDYLLAPLLTLQWPAIAAIRLVALWSIRKSAKRISQVLAESGDVGAAE